VEYIEFGVFFVIGNSIELQKLVLEREIGLVMGKM
jgi:hypothetical protein